MGYHTILFGFPSWRMQRHQCSIFHISQKGGGNWGTGRYMNLEQFPAQQHHISGGGGGGGPSEKNILGWESAGNITNEEVVEAQGGTESSTPFLPYMPPVKQPCCRAKDKDGAAMLRGMLTLGTGMRHTAARCMHSG
ncbi:Os01g0635950 [Oryza sativa Japonica Group]|uniref:Os01g0635950 protein n=1 Tax=Oryza sativa subsp. japonica TaxID=39947 RepID=A0A0P0V5M6_ORYSJ|nr:Os01g0635950 [Oryza sativa Japonica Group]